MPNKITHLPGVAAIPVKQGDVTFYILTIKGKTLLSVAYTSERTQYNKKGIQRGLRTDRLREIGNFIKNRAGKVPALPNAIIVSLSTDSYFKQGMLYIAEKASGEAFVVDGQHRLWSFSEEYSGNTDFDIVVTAFINLSDPHKAEIFRSINGNQRKINPSLVYDLIPMLRDSEAINFEDRRAQELVETLNGDSESPWKDRISMVGGADRIISQSSFITAIKKLFKKDRIFASTDPDFFEEKLQSDILLRYFRLISEEYSAEWDNKSFLLCKYVGVSALINLLDLIIKDLRARKKAISDEKELVLSDQSISLYIKKLSSFRFNATDEKVQGFTYVGEGGVTSLTNRIRKITAL
jgi:DGQHR domain-containing protein